MVGFPKDGHMCEKIKGNKFFCYIMEEPEVPVCKNQLIKP